VTAPSPRPPWAGSENPAIEVVVPPGPPVLTPRAARALLRLLVAADQPAAADMARDCPDPGVAS